MEFPDIGSKPKKTTKPPSVNIFPGSVQTSIAINDGTPILFMSGLGDDQKMYLWSSDTGEWKLAVKDHLPG